MLRTATERDTVCQGCSTTLLLPPAAQEATGLLSAHKRHVWEVAPLVFAITWAMVQHRTHSSLVWLTNMKVGYERDWPGEPTSCGRSSEIPHPRLQTSEALWDKALCPVQAIPCHLSWSKLGLRGQLPRDGGTPAAGTLGPPAGIFMLRGGTLLPASLPGAGCGQPGRCQPGLLTERLRCPWCVFTASLSGQASAPEPADKDVSDCFPHTAGFPPTKENPGKFLPTLCRAASEQRTRPSKGHKVTSWSVMWEQLPPTRRGNVGQGSHRGTPPSSLFKKSKSQQAECVPEPSEKSKAFRNGFNYSQAAKQGSLP